MSQHGALAIEGDDLESLSHTLDAYLLGVKAPRAFIHFAQHFLNDSGLAASGLAAEEISSFHKKYTLHKV
jgi:hypothetical protein